LHTPTPDISLGLQISLIIRAVVLLEALRYVIKQPRGAFSGIQKASVVLLNTAAK
jgi:hypothetical protein